jgi:hypothetical protein
MSTVALHADQASHDALGIRWLERLVRFGYVVRGIIYFVPGVLALRLALGTHGAAMTQTGAIALIGHQPFGRMLLAVVAVGLAGYVLWGVVRAVLDPLGKGHSLHGLAQRFGFAMSALAYTGLLVMTLGLIFAPASHGAPPADWAGALLAEPMGAWLVGIIGVCWIAGAGIGEIVRGWRGDFERDLELGRMGRSERAWATRLGRVGTVTRGVVFTVIGVFLVATAFHANPHHSTGMDGALLGLARQPFGVLLLAAAALGLTVFGVYSAMCARWMRIRIAAPVSRFPLPQSHTV